LPEPEDRSAVERVRRDKLAKLRAASVDAFPVGFRRSHTLAEVRRGWDGLAPGEESGDVVRVSGRIVLKRDMGRLAFWTLRHDGDELQIMLTVGALGEEQFRVACDLDIGDWVGVQGPVVKTRRGELSVKATEAFLLGKALRPLPDKWHGLTDVEVRSRQRELDLTVNPAARAAMRLRSRVVGSLREPAWIMSDAVFPALSMASFVLLYRALGAPRSFEALAVVGGIMSTYWINVLWGMGAQLYWE